MSNHGPLPTFEVEEMAPFFAKFHIRNVPFDAVLHKFTDIDRGDPHDHPWAFKSTILYGGYVEEVYHPKLGLVETRHRHPGDNFYVSMDHIHRIVDLPKGECWTLIQPQYHGTVKKSGFWQFREDGAYRRDWDQQEFTKWQ